MIGQTISHYKILEKIGEGGMGVVYKAHDTLLDRDVALKFLPPELTRDADAKARFVHEAQAASALEHPNICNIHEIGETDDGSSFIVMACYEGDTLKKKIEQKPLKIENAIETAIQVAHGLSKAHEKRIVHRDIKPANILITTDGVIKILDFGLAKLRGLSKLTKTGSTLGTAPYMSPEQAKGEEVDSTTDIWSLGVLMYEMITGQLPFKGDYEQAITYQIINATPEPITGFRTGVPVELERIVNKCLEKSPYERYQTAADLIADLKHLQRITGQIATPSSTEQTVKPSANKKLWTLIAALLVISILLILIFKPFSTKPEPNRKSIAVLPFKNLSSSKEDEYISDGIAEDIRTQLCKIAELKVISQQGVQRYKNSDKSITEIGKELNVATVLEGSVQWAGGQVRINAQLIDASDESHIWAEKYDKEKAQIFAIQSDVAQQIAAVLKAKLLPAEKVVIEKRPTDNLSAYDYYLKGREYYNLYRKQDNETAITLFKKAIELDTNYVLALAGLADAYAQRRGNFGFGPQWLDSSIAVATLALTKDSKSAEAYKALGLAYEYKGFLNKAIETNRKALEFNPNYSPALANIGDELMWLGNFAEGMKWRKKALSLTPTQAMSYAQIAMNYGFMVDDDNADKYFKRSLELQPDNPLAYIRIEGWHFHQGKSQEAYIDNEKILSLNHDTATYDNNIFWLSLLDNNIAQARIIANKFAAKGDSGYIVRIYSREGKKEKAQTILNAMIAENKKIIDAGNENPWNLYFISCAYVLKGEKIEALKYLRRAYDSGFYLYRVVMTDPDMISIRNDEQFQRIIVQMKAKMEEQKRLLAEMEKEEEGNL